MFEWLGLVSYQWENSYFRQQRLILARTAAEAACCDNLKGREAMEAREARVGKEEEILQT